MADLSLGQQIWRIKPADQLSTEGEHGGLKRTMGLLALTMFSVGSIVGTGIFVILGEAVPKAGPAVVVSFILAAIITPPDPMSQLLLAIPLVLLYTVSIGVAYVFSRRPKDEATEGENAPPSKAAE